MNNQDYERDKCWSRYYHSIYRSITEEIDHNPVAFIERVFNFAFDRAYALGKEKETITQEEIRKAAVEYAEENMWYPGETSYEGDINDMTESFADAFEAGANFALGKQEKDANIVISGWVVRDEDADCPRFYNHKPFRKKDGFKDGLWSYGMEIGVTLDSNLFPDLTWDDDPQEVEIIIKRKKQ